ncbi:hypothetical protein OHS33_33375 [Streptomyces sp. NBC_00536]|uniref:hypothetical protein n=1 Tax=Streptomyces sp. NBC_00536 TaxID=2975769 RepID=UPI002E8179A8|nr:hypothetical protein [Streptomyces sp. NBC_00536]WUC82827.1 hypothetical protein OHS33_33375 [Streptomyces sp. NBC_00536]
MTVPRRAAAALAVLAAGSALLLTGCSQDKADRPAAEQSAGPADSGEQAQMRQKLDDADKAADDADTDATQNN